MNFLSILPEIRQKTFTSRTIRHVFRDTGIYLYNPEIVIQNLRDSTDDGEVLRIFGTSETLSPPHSSLTNSPPQTIRTLRRSINKLTKHIDHSFDQNQSNKSFIKRVQRLCEYSKEQMELVHQLEADLGQYQQRSLRPKFTLRRQIRGTTGLLTVKDANRRIAERKLVEEKADIQRARRAAAK